MVFNFIVNGGHSIGSGLAFVVLVAVDTCSFMVAGHYAYAPLLARYSVISLSRLFDYLSLVLPYQLGLGPICPMLLMLC